MSILEKDIALASVRGARIRSSLLIRHPYLAMLYIRRSKVIANLTGEERRMVDRHFDEGPFVEIWNYLVKELDPYGKIHGGMLHPIDTPILYALCRALKPERVVETGVANGISTTIILQALEANAKGTLYSVEYPQGRSMRTSVPPGKAAGWLVPDRLRHRWQLILGRSDLELPKVLDQLGDIDLFLHDSEHSYENMMFEFRCAWQHLKKGGVLVTDDYKKTKAVDDFAADVDGKVYKLLRIATVGKRT